MGHVSVTLNDRVYRLVCDDGEEDRLVELATYVKAKVDELTAEHGRTGDERLLLMAALLITDELWDVRAATPQSALPNTENAKSRVAQSELTEPEPVRRLRNLASRMKTPNEVSTGEAAEVKPTAGPKRRDVA